MEPETVCLQQVQALVGESVPFVSEPASYDGSAGLS